ncbi:YraN family protein [Methyloligella sp. 2.7D]|uniref:YraN family protein n=1 Tax=unclassified Methyloligella TaxID=2625955 RepID=UPI00157D64FE|nr:YraN family protein [Methyloligella sp. GL2]QKP76152.1 YraN family protein [Methyloligella sp. GL2]
MSEKRRKAYARGVLAESLIALLLRFKGHRIVARRYRTPVGEIDLIATRGRRLAFIEVKRRSTYEAAAWSVPTRQRRRIVRAAQYWLAGHPGFQGYEMSFDVVLSAPWSFPTLIENAFEV